MGVVALCSLLIQGCGARDGRRSEPDSSTSARAPAAAERPARERLLPVRVLADTGRSETLAIPIPAPGGNRVWLGEVTPSRPAALEPELPEAAPDTIGPGVAAPAAPSAPVLKPPILRRRGTLVLPRGVRPPAVVELDVRVDADGTVREVRWAAGAGDTALVNAADQCARSMNFYPALLDGRPVEVWCRQRFEFARSAHRAGLEAETPSTRP